VIAPVTVAASYENVSAGTRWSVGAYRPYSARMFKPMSVCQSMSGGTCRVLCRRRAWTARRRGENIGELIGTPAFPAGSTWSISGVRAAWSSIHGPR
jgi:hypothetical protein